MFSATLLNRFDCGLAFLSVDCIDLVVGITTLEEPFGYTISRSCSLSFSIIFATITDGLA